MSSMRPLLRRLRYRSRSSRTAGDSCIALSPVQPHGHAASTLNSKIQRFKGDQRKCGAPRDQVHIAASRCNARHQGAAIRNSQDGRRGHHISLDPCGGQLIREPSILGLSLLRLAFCPQPTLTFEQRLLLRLRDESHNDSHKQSLKHSSWARQARCGALTSCTLFVLGGPPTPPSRLLRSCSVSCSLWLRLP